MKTHEIHYYILSETTQPKPRFMVNFTTTVVNLRNCTWKSYLKIVVFVYSSVFFCVCIQHFHFVGLVNISLTKFTCRDFAHACVQEGHYLKIVRRSHIDTTFERTACQVKNSSDLIKIMTTGVGGESSERFLGLHRPPAVRSLVGESERQARLISN